MAEKELQFVCLACGRIDCYDSRPHGKELEPQICSRRAPVQGDSRNGYVAGSVSWSEHVEAWKVYNRTWSQSAERIAERGGFSHAELTDLLGHEPTTWEARRRG